MAIVRIQCTGERRRDLGWGFHTDGREFVCSLTLYLWRIAPVGGGADGEGDGTFPPLSRRVTGNVFSCE